MTTAEEEDSTDNKGGTGRRPAGARRRPFAGHAVPVLPSESIKLTKVSPPSRFRLSRHASKCPAFDNCARQAPSMLADWPVSATTCTPHCAVSAPAMSRLNDTPRTRSLISSLRVLGSSLSQARLLLDGV